MSGVSASNGMRQNKLIGLILLIVPSLIIIVGILMSVLVWMGYTMATAPREK
jgi:hypothetical protein